MPLENHGNNLQNGNFTWKSSLSDRASDENFIFNFKLQLSGQHTEHILKETVEEIPNENNFLLETNGDATFDELPTFQHNFNETHITSVFQELLTEPIQSNLCPLSPQEISNKNPFQHNLEIEEDVSNISSLKSNEILSDTSGLYSAEIKLSDCSNISFIATNNENLIQTSENYTFSNFGEWFSLGQSSLNTFNLFTPDGFNQNISNNFEEIENCQNKEPHFDLNQFTISSAKYSSVDESGQGHHNFIQVLDKSNPNETHLRLPSFQSCFKQNFTCRSEKPSTSIPFFDLKHLTKSSGMRKMKRRRDSSQIILPKQSDYVQKHHEISSYNQEREPGYSTEMVIPEHSSINQMDIQKETLDKNAFSQAHSSLNGRYNIFKQVGTYPVETIRTRKPLFDLNQFTKSSGEHNVMVKSDSNQIIVPKQNEYIYKNHEMNVPQSNFEQRTEHGCYVGMVKSDNINEMAKEKENIFSQAHTSGFRKTFKQVDTCQVETIGARKPLFDLSQFTQASKKDQTERPQNILPKEHDSVQEEHQMTALPKCNASQKTTTKEYDFIQIATPEQCIFDEMDIEESISLVAVEQDTHNEQILNASSNSFKFLIENPTNIENHQNEFITTSVLNQTCDTSLPCNTTGYVPSSIDPNEYTNYNEIGNNLMLSAYSDNLDNADQRIREGINRISNDKTLRLQETEIQSDTDEEIKRKLINKIEEVLMQFLRNASTGKRVEFAIRKSPKNTGTPTKYKIVSRRNKTTRNKFSLIVYLLCKIHCLTLTNQICTQREIYYQLKNICVSQGRIRSTLYDIGLLIDVDLWQLPIISCSKGLVFGDLKIFMESGDIVSCNMELGTLVPHSIRKIKNFESPAYFILVVEKDAIFQKLLDEKIPSKLTRPFIMVTGKGFPDINTRLFIRKLTSSLKIPIFILVDPDPYGIEIMLTYRFGSLNMKLMSDKLRLPNLRWIGVHPSEIIPLNITRQALTESEKKKIKIMMRRPYLQDHPTIINELKVLLENNFKAEIEGVIKSSSYLTDFYLSNKFYNLDFI